MPIRERVCAGSTSNLKNPHRAEVGAAQLAVTCRGPNQRCARPPAPRSCTSTSVMLCFHPSGPRVPGHKSDRHAQIRPGHAYVRAQAICGLLLPMLVT